MISVLTACAETHSSKDENDKKTFNQLINVLSIRLASTSYLARKAVRQALQFISTSSGISVEQLLDPWKASITTPIYEQPLRSLPTAVQTGYCEAISFCLNLRPSIIPVTPELLKMANHALAIADKDELSPKIPNLSRSIQDQTLLKVACMDLLAALICVHDWPAELDFNSKDPKALDDIRLKAMSLFYKYLTSRIPEIVESAKRALGQVISSGKLSTELMKGTAKPILQNFQEYKKLTVPLLQGIARLVELGPTLFTDKVNWNFLFLLLFIILFIFIFL